MLAIGGAVAPDPPGFILFTSPLLPIMSDNNQKTVSPHVTSLNKRLVLKEEGFNPLLVSFKGLNKRIDVYFIVNSTETNLPHCNCL